MIPTLTRIESTAKRGTYSVRLIGQGGEVLEALMHVATSTGPPVVAPEPDVFRDWPGDAESIRRVVAAVIAMHEAQGDVGE